MNPIKNPIQSDPVSWLVPSNSNWSRICGVLMQLECSLDSVHCKFQNYLLSPCLSYYFFSKLTDFDPNITFLFWLRLPLLLSRLLNNVSGAIVWYLCWHGSLVDTYPDIFESLIWSDFYFITQRIWLISFLVRLFLFSFSIF